MLTVDLSWVWVWVWVWAYSRSSRRHASSQQFFDLIWVWVWAAKERDRGNCQQRGTWHPFFFLLRSEGHVTPFTEKQKKSCLSFFFKDRIRFQSKPFEKEQASGSHVSYCSARGFLLVSQVIHILGSFFGFVFLFFFWSWVRFVLHYNKKGPKVSVGQSHVHGRFSLVDGYNVCRFVEPSTVDNRPRECRWLLLAFFFSSVKNDLNPNLWICSSVSTIEDYDSHQRLEVTHMRMLFDRDTHTLSYKLNSPFWVNLESKFLNPLCSFSTYEIHPDY